MKRKFDINEFNKYHVMHCRTKEDAIAFLELLNSYGLRWDSGDSYLERNCYRSYGQDTCYRFLNGTYCNYWTYANNSKYTILEFEDFDFEHLDDPFDEEKEFSDFISEFRVTG